ncbi:unnamed protein product [Colletotrichum noveboracense]|uniref:Uncharacterized protein n=1 Tax=Colletotrichum noveboracense TaxID=2664923 RepID=A0A9W4WEQ1_9PEZI|nr:unnamed protein product [Colletotrichum noveboracense]
MEPRIIPSQLPPGLEIAIPPGHDLPPQQPSSTYQRKPLPPLPPLRPGLSRQVSAFSVASRTTINSTRSRSRRRNTPSPAPSGRGAIERLENEISTILIQHSPTPASRRSSEHRSCSPTPRRLPRDEEVSRALAPRRLSTPNLPSSPLLLNPITTPCTLHRSSAKIKQITGLDVAYKAIPPPRPPRSPLPPGKLAFPPSTPDNPSNPPPPSSSEPTRTLGLITDDYDDESDFDSDWDFSPSSKRNYASWIPASPVPPRVSYVGAKDLYHATATSIANSERKKAAVSSRASTESGRDSIVPPKNRLSFATKVLQSGRKRPPTGINTTTQSQSPSPPGPMTGSGRLTAGSRPDMHAHSMDDDRLRVKYSDAISRVFRWSGEHRRAVSEGTSPVDGPGAEPRTVATPTTAKTVSSMSSSGTGSPVTAANSPNRMARRSVQNLAAHVRRTASVMVQSKDERRRENLRQSIRVIPEGSAT